MRQRSVTHSERILAASSLVSANALLSNSAVLTWYSRMSGALVGPERRLGRRRGVPPERLRGVDHILGIGMIERRDRGGLHAVVPVTVAIAPIAISH